MRRHVTPRSLAWTGLAVAGAVLLTAYAGIAVQVGDAWPWNTVVHEDGRRTLLQTVLYFEHAARELPPDVLLGIAIGAAVAYAVPAHRPASGLRSISRWMWLAAAALIGLIVVGAWVHGGGSALADNLLQKHSRPGYPLSVGTHWRYHLGSRLALMLAAMGFAAALRLLHVVPRDDDGRAGRRCLAVTLAVYAAVSLAFAGGVSEVVWTFTDPVPLGHQARELFTHATVTLPAGWGACLLLAGRLGGPAEPTGPRSAADHAGFWLAAGLAGVMLGAGVGLAALSADAAAHGQTDNLAMLVFPHYFEHTLSYLLVPVLACLTYLLLARAARA